MNKLLPVLLIVFIVIAGGYFLLSQQNPSSPITLPQGEVCDSETMTCSDGTVLRKQGPNCDFPPCPDGESNGETITISGTTICLPHKNSSGPQTLECALGLEGDDGNKYGLSDPGWKYLIGTGNGVRVEIKGELTKKEDSKYDSAGVIEIESLSKL